MRFAARSLIRSPYLESTASLPAVRFPLGSSNVEAVRGLPAHYEEMRPKKHPREELTALLAARAGVREECVVLAYGTSQANHLAMTALFDPGDEVLVEQPTYDPLLYLVRLLGGELRRLPRREENGWAIDPDELRRALTPRTRLVVLCNLHNPTSAQSSQAELAEIGAAAQRVGARVLVDEVYREAVWGAERGHALSLGDNFVVSSSLTKAFGLGSLRCGWILAEPALAASMERLQELTVGSMPLVTQHLSASALKSLPELEARARRNLDANRSTARELLATHPAVSLAVPEFGTTVAPRLLHGTADDFCRLLRERYEVGVASGAYFEMPQHLRIGLGGEPEAFCEGVLRVRQALEERANGATPKPRS